MKPLYGHLEERGRRIFRATYNGVNDKEEALLEEEIHKYLSQVFFEGAISILKKEGSIPDLDTLFKEVLSVISKGIFLEAIELSKEGKGIVKDTLGKSLLHNAVDKSRGRVDLLIEAFKAKPANITTLDAESYNKKEFPRSFSDEITLLKKQTTEVEKKYEESQATRKKTELRLQEAMIRFQKRNQEFIDQKAALEREKLQLISERNQLGKVLEETREMATRALGRGDTLERTIEERDMTLQIATEKIKNMEMKLKGATQLGEILTGISEELRLVAKDGDTGPERFHSLMKEVIQLREREKIFLGQDISHSGPIKEEEKPMLSSEALTRELREISHMQTNPDIPMSKVAILVYAQVAGS